MVIVQTDSGGEFEKEFAREVENTANSIALRRLTRNLQRHHCHRPRLCAYENTITKTDNCRKIMETLRSFNGVCDILQKQCET